MTSRYRWFAIALTPIYLVACAAQQQPPSNPQWQVGRLAARPTLVTSGAAATGLQRLNLGSGRDGVVYVPKRVQSPAPLLLMLHGSGASGERILRRIQPMADAIGAIVVAPDARDYTWDVAKGRVTEDGGGLDRIGADVAFIDRALERVFARYAIDPKHIAIGGFSDGASYALSLGLANGDLFTHIIAFSPGFVRLHTTAGQPQIFLSHGTADRVLPIDQTARRIARALQEAGYDLEYVEFPGEHTVPDQIAQEALTAWFGG